MQGMRSSLMRMRAAADSGIMRIVSILALSALFGGVMPAKMQDYHKLPSIERIGQNLYQSEKAIIETHACLHMPVDEEDALLKYLGPEKYEIVWEDRSTCEVQRVTLGDSLPI
jgi:hypothetical protein